MAEVELGQTGLIVVFVILAVLITMPWALVIMRFRTCGLGIGRRKIAPELVEKVTDAVKDTALDILKSNVGNPDGSGAAKAAGIAVKAAVEINKDLKKQRAVPGVPGKSTLYAGAGGIGEWQTKDLNDAVNGVVGKQLYGDSWQLQRKGKVSGAVVDGLTKVLEKSQDRLNAKIDSVSHYEVDLDTCPSRFSFWFVLAVALVLTVAAAALIIYLYKNRAEPKDPCLVNLNSVDCDAKTFCDNPSTSLDIERCEAYCDVDKTNVVLYNTDCIRYHCRDKATEYLDKGEDLWGDETKFESDLCFDSCIADAAEGRTRTTSCLRITCGAPVEDLDRLLPPVDGQGVEGCVEPNPGCTPGVNCKCFVNPNRTALDANCAAYCDISRGNAFESYCIERACGDDTTSRCNCHFYIDEGVDAEEAMCREYCDEPRNFSDAYCIKLRCRDEPLLHCDQTCTNENAFCVPYSGQPYALGFLGKNIFLDVVETTVQFVDSPPIDVAEPLNQFRVLQGGDETDKDVYVIATKVGGTPGSGGVEVGGTDYWVRFDKYDRMQLTTVQGDAQLFLVISTGQAFTFLFRTRELRNTGAGTMGYRFMGYTRGEYGECPCPFIPALMPRPLNLGDVEWYYGPLAIENNLNFDF